MTTIEELRKAVNQFSNAIYFTCKCQLMTGFAEHLYCKINGRTDAEIDAATEIGSIRYEVNNLVEVIREDASGYEHLIELQKALQA